MKSAQLTHCLLLLDRFLQCFLPPRLNYQTPCLDPHMKGLVDVLHHSELFAENMKEGQVSPDLQWLYLVHRLAYEQATNNLPPLPSTTEKG